MSKEKKIRIKITHPGIYGKNGAIEVGEEFEVSEVPAGWQGLCQVMSETPKNPKAVTNQAEKA